MLDSRAAIEALDDQELDLLGILALANRPTDPQKWAALAEQRGVVVHAIYIEQLATTLVERGLVIERSHWSVRQFSVPVTSTLLVLETLRANHRLERLHGHSAPHQHRADPQALGTVLRLAVLERRWDVLELTAVQAERRIGLSDYGRWLCDSLGPAAPRVVLEKLPATTRDKYLARLIEFAREDLYPVNEDLTEFALAGRSKKLRLDVGRLLIMRGEIERATSLTGLGKQGNQTLSLLAAFWAGDYAAAAQLGADLVAAMTGRKHKALTKIDGYCHILAGLAISGDDPRQLQTIAAVLEASSQSPTVQIDGIAGLERIHQTLLGDSSARAPRFGSWHRTGASWARLWADALHDIWLELRVANDAGERERSEYDNAIDQLRAWAKRATDNGYGPLASELNATLAAIAREPRSPREADDRESLVSSFHAPTAWEAAIAGLDTIVDDVPPEAIAAAQGRALLWELRVRAGVGELSPRIRESARARKGKPVALNRLLAGDEDCLSDEDQRVLGAAEPEQRAPTIRGKHKPRALILGDRALSALVGHPRVIDPDGKPLAVERRQPKLRTRRKHGKVLVELTPTELNDRALLCMKSGSDRVLIYERTPALARVAEVLRGKLEVPEQGVERLARTLARLSVSAAIEIEGDLTPEAERVEADPRPVLLLEWDGETLRVRARVAPLGLVGVHLKPGVGNPMTSAQVPDKGGGLRMLRCQRDLAEEHRGLAALERGCPTLMSYAETTTAWCIPGIPDSLEIMAELGRLGDAVVLAWPEGRALRPPIERDLTHLRVAVSSGQSWLEIDAKLELEPGVVLSFRELIDARAGQRFVALGQDRFLALSERLRWQLDALQNLGTRKAEGLRATPAMLPVLDGFAGVSFDAIARERLERLRTINDARPRLPRGFQAKLRDYQREGYTWLWRLAEAGLGACLADDMGLGKTIQALALLSQRASKGPALVVCPTSVVVNWVNETEKFAPTLRTTILADASDRASALAQAGRRDLIVCSYGLLVTETEALASIEFGAVVFDEAHALKNEETKRSRAARKLQTEFCLGLTGTPIENRVEELWGLFRVLVPGLLGSKAHFDERFAKPIARGQPERATQLRALLEHFILRRTKGQVLAELPPRTDISVCVPQAPAARAYYEALRQRAVDTVENGDKRKKRFRILAEITRLRQAAVDPRLLDAHTAPAGAKIDALIELVLALREEGHRALVFTQFLGSMALLRERFATAEIEYLEIDGSTSATERGRRVEAFQAGEADVFVLSLRAGGVGINLTAADYVLHLDPWWNPAVEDQATDRAHRIGQTRPVTVYRLISEGTIEEKILALHGRKRDLADGLLAGLERSDALNIDELMALLSD